MLVGSVQSVLRRFINYLSCCVSGKFREEKTYRFDTSDHESLATRMLAYVDFLPPPLYCHAAFGNRVTKIVRSKDDVKLDKTCLT
jgi:hypothetical protein